MATRLLGRLFDQDDLELVVELIGELQQDVGTTAFALPALEAESTAATVVLFDQPLQANGSFSARLGLLGNAARLDPFDTGQEYEPRDGFNVAEMDVDAAFGVNGEAAAAHGALSLSAKAAAAGSLSYQHWLPVRGTSRLNAFARSVTRSRFPQRVGLAQNDPGFPRPGEVHRLQCRLGLDLGLDFELGRSVQDELTVELFGGLSTPLRVNGEAVIKASLGLSILDQMALTVGRACQIRPGWTRIRVQRSNERRLSIGVSIELQLAYDLGSGLVAILEEATSQARLPQLVESLRQMTDRLARGNWDDFLREVSDEASEHLTEFLDGTGWREWLANSPEVAGLSEISSSIVRAYDELDPRIQSWWDRLLGEVDLEPGSSIWELLEQVAGLDPRQPITGLISGDATRLVDLIEVFTGSSLEDLLLGSDQSAREALAEASSLAQEALDFLTDVPVEAIAQVRSFLDRTGIVRIVDFLRQNNISKETIEDQVTTRIQKLVEGLVDKAWDSISQDDLHRVRAWAQHVQGLLTAPQELEAKIKASLEKLKLDYGFSASLEVERLSRSTALLDLELDVRQSHRRLQRNLAKALEVGNVRRMLQVLAEEADDEDYEQNPLPFLLRECVFTSERIRTVALSAFLSIFGLGRSFLATLGGTRRRIEQTTLRVEQSAGDTFFRSGEYAAAFERGESANKANSTAAVWIECRDQGEGLDLDATYALGDATHTLRLTFSREDDAASQDERTSLDHLLRDLGFADDLPVDGPAAPAPPSGLTRLSPSALVPLESRVRLSLEIRFPGAVLTTFTDQLDTPKGEQLWDRAFLNATHRWLSDKSVHRATVGPTRASVGPVLARYIQHSLFLDNWRSGSGVLRNVIANADPVTVTVSGGSVVVKATEQELALPVWRRPFGLLEPIVEKRGTGLRAMRNLARRWADTDSRTPAAYDALLPAFSSAWRRSSVYSVNWPNPLFGIWLLVARLTLVQPDLLGKAKGVALLHWKAEDDDAWNPPWIWQIDNGIPNNLERGPFPFS